MEQYDAILEARRLIRAGRAASLATGQAGQPFASLVTPASAPDLSPLMLLSSLSEHTRHLQADPRCALLITGAPTGPNPQTAPRVTVTGIAELVPADQVAALKARWLAVHPYAALYADFGDFALWRVTIGGALLVGGFARAVRLKASALAPDEAAVAAVAAAEAEIIAHVNEDHADAGDLVERSREQHVLPLEVVAGAGRRRFVGQAEDGRQRSHGNRKPFEHRLASPHRDHHQGYADLGRR